MIDLTRFDGSAKERSKGWAALDEALYDLCRKHPGHKSANFVNAKVWIIGYAYGTGINRRVRMEKLCDYVLRHGARVDSIIRRLKCGRLQLTSAKLERIVQAHGQLVKLLQPCLIRHQSPRSFVSKYLHFHNHLVPVYDSIAYASLSRRCRWNDSLQVFPMPREADKEYYWFVCRFWRLYDEIRQHRPKATVKEVDYFLLSE